MSLLVLFLLIPDPPEIGCSYRFFYVTFNTFYYWAKPSPFLRHISLSRGMDLPIDILKFRYCDSKITLFKCLLYNMYSATVGNTKYFITAITGVKLKKKWIHLSTPHKIMGSFVSKSINQIRNFRQTLNRCVAVCRFSRAEKRGKNKWSGNISFIFKSNVWMIAINRHVGVALDDKLARKGVWMTGCSRQTSDNVGLRSQNINITTAEGSLFKLYPGEYDGGPSYFSGRLSIVKLGDYSST